MAEKVDIKIKENSMFMNIVPYLVISLIIIVLVGLVAYKFEWGYFKDKLTKDSNEKIIANVLGNKTSNQTEEKNETIIIEKIINCNKTDNGNIYSQGICTEYDNKTILNEFTDYCINNVVTEFRCMPEGCIKQEYDCDAWMGVGSLCIGGKCTQNDDCSKTCWDNGYLGGFCGETNSTITYSECTNPRDGVYLEIVGMKSDGWCSQNSIYNFCCCY